MFFQLCIQIGLGNRNEFTNGFLEMLERVYVGFAESFHKLYDVTKRTAQL